MGMFFECNRCLFNSNVDKHLSLDEHGLCNHCQDYDRKSEFIKSYELDSPEIISLISQIKKKNRGSKYDCLIGLSGGVDSTYVALIVKKLGLNALALHFDNGWNSALAVVNIENTVKKLGFDLYTYVVDWGEFKDLQLAYIKASVVDIEAVADQGITAAMIKVARKFRIKTIISGENIRTEGTLPKDWVYIKSDHRNIRDIHKKFGTIKLKTYPIVGYFKRILLQRTHQYEYIPLLDFVKYDKEFAKEQIISELDWRDYGGKHFESIFTRFYQSYILPGKFNIDKRYSHYSTMICARQISKAEALELISGPICDPQIIRDDKLYVCKKFRITEAEFDDLMSQPERSHLEYSNIYQLINRLGKIKGLAKKAIGRS